VIKKFNRNQFIYGSLRLLLSLFVFILTYGFFRWVVSAINHSLELELSSTILLGIPSVCVLAIAIAGIYRWKTGQREFTITESFISHQLDTDTGGAWGTQNYMNRVTGPAYFLTMLFLAAPMQMIKAYEHFQSVIPLNDQLEQRMIQLLAELQSENKWQDFDARPDHRRELIFLINMGKVEYSPQKGRIRAYAQ